MYCYSPISSQAARVSRSAASARFNISPLARLDILQFGPDEDSLRNRQLFLCDAGGTAIGTATAWFNHNYRGTTYGRIHWVAIVPRMQGKGLAKPLLAAACNRLRELGHTQAYLVSETIRIPAINLYLKFGFRPEIRDEQDVMAWRAIEGCRTKRD